MTWVQCSTAAGDRACPAHIFFFVKISFSRVQLSNFGGLRISSHHLVYYCFPAPEILCNEIGFIFGDEETRTVLSS
jgi:hypothetical protein